MECSKHTPTPASTKEFLNTLFISSKGVAGIAKVSLEALDAMARNGDGPRFVMKDGERRYSLAAVGEWMAGRNHSQPGGTPSTARTADARLESISLIPRDRPSD